MTSEIPPAIFSDLANEVFASEAECGDSDGSAVWENNWIDLGGEA